MDTATAKSTVNLVIVTLGIFALVALVGVLWLTDNGTDATSIAVIVGPMGVALGAVGGVLASTRTPVPANPPVVMDPPVAQPVVPVDVQPTLAVPLAPEDHAG